MNVGTLRLLFAGVWAVVAVGLWLAPTGGRYPAVAPLLAVAFAAWNVARWRQGRASGGVQPRRPNRRPTTGERNPAFDFGQPPDGGADRSRTPANGG